MHPKNTVEAILLYVDLCFNLAHTSGRDLEMNDVTVAKILPIYRGKTHGQSEVVDVRMSKARKYKNPLL